MTTKTSAIVLMIICTLFTSAAQITYKFGVNNPNLTIKLTLIFAGLAMYGVGAGLLILALKSGELSVLYPIIATSYVIVSLGANYFFNETISLIKWVGIALILAGVYYIGRGSSKWLQL